MFPGIGPLMPNQNRRQLEGEARQRTAALSKEIDQRASELAALRGEGRPQSRRRVLLATVSLTAVFCVVAVVLYLLLRG